MNIGPGKYHKNSKKLTKGHSPWSKDTRFNYNRTEKKQEDSPGSYSIRKKMINKNKIANSVFNSKSKKSHIDELIDHKIKMQEKKINPEY